jgi:hypothetical protein
VRGVGVVVGQQGMIDVETDALTDVSADHTFVLEGRQHTSDALLRVYSRLVENLLQSVRLRLNETDELACLLVGSSRLSVHMRKFELRVRSRPELTPPMLSQEKVNLGLHLSLSRADALLDEVVERVVINRRQCPLVRKLILQETIHLSWSDNGSCPFLTLRRTQVSTADRIVQIAELIVNPDSTLLRHDSVG